MKVGNLVAIKYKYTIRYDNSKEKTEDIGSAFGMVRDVVTSERDGKSYVLEDRTIKEKHIISSKVILD